MSDPSDTEPVARRRFLQAVGAVGATVAVAGCVADEEGENGTPTARPPMLVGAPPEPDIHQGQPQAVQEILEQLEWQNEAIWELVRDTRE